jgi:DNA-binding NarL/FixJ family response regulator
VRSRILIVDDFEDFRRFVCSLLQQRVDFQVAQVSDGLEAVQKAKELQSDVILLDIGLPGLNGMEVARRVRKLAPSAKILFLTQESSPEVVREALSLGALGYVHKPRVHSDLLPAIEAVLEGKRFVSSSLEFSEAADAQSPSTHQMLFCSDDAALLGGLTRFIATALNAGNPAFVLATESHLHRLLQRLQSRAVDIDAAIQRGTYISLDAGQEPDPVRFSEAIRRLSAAASRAGKEHPRVAVFGERAGRLWEAGKADQAIRFEQFGNELAKCYVIDILCAYPLPHSQEDDPALKSICAIHSGISFR